GRRWSCTCCRCASPSASGGGWATPTSIRSSATSAGPCSGYWWEPCPRPWPCRPCNPAGHRPAGAQGGKRKPGVFRLPGCVAFSGCSTDHVAGERADVSRLLGQHDVFLGDAGPDQLLGDRLIGPVELDPDLAVDDVEVEERPVDAVAVDPPGLHGDVVVPV